MFKRNLLFRTFLTFSIVVFLYSGLLMWTTIAKHYERLAYQNNSLNEQFLEKTSLSIDNRLEVLFTYINFLSEKESIDQYLREEDNEFASFSTLYDDLVNNLFSISQLGFNIGVAKDINGYIVSPDGYFLFDDYIKHLDLEKELYRIKNILSNKTNSTYEYIAGRDKSIMIIKQTQESTQKSIYYFIVFDNGVVLPDSLPNDTGMFVFGNQDSRLFEIGPPKELNSGLPKGRDNKGLVSSEKIDDQTFFMRRSGVIPSMTYYYSVPNTKVTALTKESISSLIWMLSSLVIMGVGIVFFSSRKNYMPIKQILQNFDDHQDKNRDLLADQNELDFILENIKRINAANQELELEYSKSLYAMQEDFLKEVIFGATDNLAAKLSELQLTDYQNGGTLVILSLEGVSELEANLSEFNVLTLRKRIIQTYQASMNSQLFMPVAIDYRRFCLFFLEKDIREVTAVLEALKNLIEKENAVDITFTIANPIADIARLPHAYNEALSLLDVKYSFVETKIISTKSPAINNREDYNYSLESEQLFLNTLKTKNYGEGIKYIVDLTHDNFTKRQMNIHSTIEFKYALINTIKRSLNYVNKSFLEFSNSHYLLFEKITSNDSGVLEDAFVHIFTRVIQEVKAVNEGTDKTTPERIVEYLQENYQGDISLTAIATRFNLSESYVSRVIKEATGTSFKNYINALKVDKAKELLSTGKYKVNEVSEMVGCNNVNTFIRIFKQFEGQSPGQFMRDC